MQEEAAAGSREESGMVGTEAVGVGSWVLVRDGHADELWRIVSREEADPGRGRISEQSPVARALLGRRAGDQVRVEGPVRRTLGILRVWSGAEVRVVGGSGAPPASWQEVLEGAESLRLLRLEDGVALYEVLTRSGRVELYQVEE